MKFRIFAPHALKGQKLLAQGNALGIKAFSKMPLQGDKFANITTQGVALG